MENIREAWQRTLDVTFEWLPRLVGAMVVFIIGWIIAGVVRSLVYRLLSAARLDERLHAGHGGNIIQNMFPNPSRILAMLSFWIVFLGGVTLAAGALGSSLLNNAIATIYGYVPNVIAALAIFIIAGAVSAAVVALIHDAMPDSATGAFLSSMTPLVIMAIAIFMILNQLGIARDIVVITYAAIMGAISLSTALAFGFGGREMAGRLLDNAYTRSQQARGPINEAARNVRNKANQVTKNRRSR